MERRELKELVRLAEVFDSAFILWSGGEDRPSGKFRLICGFGEKRKFSDLSQLDNESLKFGTISYDYKNQIENLESKNEAFINVPDIYFIEPEYYYAETSEGEILSDLPAEYFSKIQAGNEPEFYPVHVEWRGINKSDYLNTIADIREDIRNGEYYELNFCTEWQSYNRVKINPYELYIQLCNTAPAPFSAFVKTENNYLLCSSPERFFSFEKNRITSQPIKGTRKRKSNRHEDSLVRTELMTSEKDRAENVMITDLVRNDLSRICEAGTVEVDELCGIHSFSHVHQMISTIHGTLKPGITFKDIIHATFPMGSMTGAPKVNVMKYIDRYENFRRGWYSGTVGYLWNGLADFNVVIRSLQYDSANEKLAYHVGGAITYDSRAEEEYDECLTKASGILDTLKKEG